MNADLIRKGITQEERLKKLREIAYYQMQSLTKNQAVEKIRDSILLDEQDKK